MEASVQGGDRPIRDGMNAFERGLKRAGDCLLAFIALTIFSPLMLACYIAVKREDGKLALEAPKLDPEAYRAWHRREMGRFGDILD